MNAYDPQLTAYALDELDPRERAQIEQLLHENPQAADEVTAVQSVSRLLSNTLRVEKAEPLSADHRAAVLQAAGVRMRTPTNVVEGPSWWRSWQFAATAAACMVFGFGAYAIFDALTEPRPTYARAQAKADGVEIGVPSADAEVRSVAKHAPSFPAEPSIPQGSIATPNVQPQPLSGKVLVNITDIGPQLSPSTPLPEMTVTPTPAPEIATATAPPIVTAKPRTATRTSTAPKKPLKPKRKKEL